MENKIIYSIYLWGRVRNDSFHSRPAVIVRERKLIMVKFQNRQYSLDGKR